jgi:ABC-type transporter Mla MlaB component
VYNLEFDELKSTAVVKFYGDSTVDTVSEVRYMLLETLKRSDEIVIDVSSVENIDVVFLQLLTALHQNASSKKCMIEHSGNESYLNKVYSCGFPGSDWLTGKSIKFKNAREENE